MKSNDLNFEYIEDFADYIVEKVECDEDLFLTVIGKFEEIKDIIKEVCAIAEVDFDFIEIESPMMDNYYDEFILSLWANDGVVEVGCEKLKNEEGEYTNPCGDETYLLDNVSSKIIPLCDGSDLYFVDIDDECDCDEDCDCECTCACHEEECCVTCAETANGDIHGFTASKSTENGYHSYSFYTNDTLSEDEIRSMLKKFGF